MKVTVAASSRVTQRSCTNEGAGKDYFNDLINHTNNAMVTATTTDRHSEHSGVPKFPRIPTLRHAGRVQCDTSQPPQEAFTESKSWSPAWSTPQHQTHTPPRYTMRPSPHIVTNRAGCGTNLHRIRLPVSELHCVTRAGAGPCQKEVHGLVGASTVGLSDHVALHLNRGLGGNLFRDMSG